MINPPTSIAAAGATSAHYLLLRLPGEVAHIFTQWRQQQFPGRAAHVPSIIRQCRAGELYQSGFGTRKRDTGVFADLLAQRFDLAIRYHGLDGEQSAPDRNAFTHSQPEQQELFCYCTWNGPAF